jgi:competence protein ComEA
MDLAPSTPASGAPPTSTAIATGPLLGCPAPTVVTPPATPPAPSTLQQAWPRSAQWATAFLLGALLTLLTIHSLGYLRYGSRPTELERGPVLPYRVDLNHARRAELLQLPGVGASMAQRIEDYRQAHGGFRSVQELTRIHGIGPATLERLQPWVFVTAEASEEEAAPAAVDPVRQVPVVVKRPLSAPTAANSKKAASLTGRIDLNEASAEELRRLPGIGPKLSQRIVDERHKGPFKTVDELRRVPGIGPKTMERLRPYISVQTKPLRIVTAE